MVSLNGSAHLGGRETILTPKLRAGICSGLARGGSIRAVCDAAGIGESTFHLWMGKGADGTTPYVEFMEGVKTARAKAEAVALAVIRKAALGWMEETHEEGVGAQGPINKTRRVRKFDWTAAAWFLERSMPERWSRRERHEVTGAEGGPIENRVLVIVPDRRG